MSECCYCFATGKQAAPIAKQTPWGPICRSCDGPTVNTLQMPGLHVVGWREYGDDEDRVETFIAPLGLCHPGWAIARDYGLKYTMDAVDEAGHFVLVSHEIIPDGAQMAHGYCVRLVKEANGAR